MALLCKPSKAFAVSLADKSLAAVKRKPFTVSVSPRFKALKLRVAVSAVFASPGIITVVGATATAGGSAGLRMTGKSTTLLPLTVDVKTTAFKLVPLVAAVLNPVN